MSKLVSVAVAVIALLIVVALIFSAFGFIAHRVQPNEVGVITNKGRVVEVVGPGIYTRFGLWWDVDDIKVEGLTACATDPEVLTRDQQRIGVTTCSTVHRPGASVSLEDYARVYGEFKSLLTNDEALVGVYDNDGNLLSEGKTQEIQKQAMKSCVGDRTFAEAAVGASRDELKACLEERQNVIGLGFLIKFKNVTVPNITIHPSVQEKLDQITKEKFETDVQRQQALRIKAEAEAELARKQGEIKVSQGSIQEQQRQRAITAELEQAAIEAELVVIQAEKANELAEAKLALAVTEAELEVRLKQALATLAPEQALAELYQENPAYVEYLVLIAQAQAWGDTDKVFLPEGVTPKVVISPDGDISVVVEPGE